MTPGIPLTETIGDGFSPGHSMSHSLAIRSRKQWIHFPTSPVRWRYDGKTKEDVAFNPEAQIGHRLRLGPPRCCQVPCPMEVNSGLPQKETRLLEPFCQLLG